MLTLFRTILSLVMFAYPFPSTVFAVVLMLVVMTDLAATTSPWQPIFFFFFENSEY